MSVAVTTLMLWSALAGLPEYLSLPQGVKLTDDRLVAEVYGEAAIRIDDNDPAVKRGRHWAGVLEFEGHQDDSMAEELWTPLKDALTAAGWTVHRTWLDLNPAFATLRYQKRGKDTWASFAFFSANDVRFDIVEAGNQPLKLQLNAPAPGPETLGLKQDFPYLPPPPGARLAETEQHDGPLFVALNEGEEPQLISLASARRTYGGLDTLSTLQFAIVYGDALERAGWRVIRKSQGLAQIDAVIVAHYAKASRDLWAQLRFAGELTIQVADVGSEDLAGALRKQCRLPLRGVNFDIDKAALRPESSSVLERVARALKGNSALVVEVQGHTDNVGEEEHNAKLSHERAEAVRTWLAQRGIAAKRLSSKGYGESQPISDNESPEGRATNRRVQLAVGGCR